jgi:transposase InsO family protein
MLCRVVGASVSGFHAWLRAVPSVQARAAAEAELRGLIGRIFAARRRAYGSRRVHAELRREGRRHARRRVERLMREMGLQARRGRRRPPRTTDSRHDLPVAPVKAERNLPRSAEVKFPRCRFRCSAGIRGGRLRAWADGRVVAEAAVA